MFVLANVLKSCMAKLTIGTAKEWLHSYIGVRSGITTSVAPLR